MTGGVPKERERNRESSQVATILDLRPKSHAITSLDKSAHKGSIPSRLTSLRSVSSRKLSAGARAGSEGGLHARRELRLASELRFRQATTGLSR
jgi:hypothetical protein